MKVLLRFSKMPLLEIKNKLSFMEYVTLELSCIHLSGKQFYVHLLRISRPQLSQVLGEQDFALTSIRVRCFDQCPKYCFSGSSGDTWPTEGASTPLELNWEHVWVVLMPLVDDEPFQHSEFWKWISVSIKYWNVKNFAFFSRLVL